MLAGFGGYLGGSLESEVLLSSVVVTGLWLVVSGLLVGRLLISGLLLWIRSGLIRRLLVVAVAGTLIDGLNSGWIGIAHGLIAVGALLLLLQLPTASALIHLVSNSFTALPVAAAISKSCAPSDISLISSPNLMLRAALAPGAALTSQHFR